MPAQIRPTRLDVTDRFPMVAFRIRADGGTNKAEVVVAADPGLFTAEGVKQRTAANFYSTRGNGGVRFSNGEASYTLPPEVLTRFIGNQKLYFGLATADQTGAMRVAVVPTTGSPYISLKGLTGRSLTRVRVLPNRQQIAAGYRQNNQANLEWTGDTAAPGMQPVPAGAAPGRGAPPTSNGAAPTPAPYDDGFGPLPPSHPEETPVQTAPPAAPSQQQAADSRGLGFVPAMALSGEPVPVTPPSVTVAGTFARVAIEAGIAAVAGPLGGFFSLLRTAANALGCSVGFGPQVGAGLGAGGALGAGIIFGKDGDLGIYGAAEIDIGFITSVSATAVVTIVRDGIDEFNGWTFALAINGGEGVVGGAAVLLNDRSEFVGASANVGIGAGFSPVDFYVSAQRGWATRVLSLAQSASSPLLDRPRAKAPRANGQYAARAMGGDPWSVNWDDVQLIAQPTDISCWAASAAMLIGWRDQVSIAPESIAQIAGRSTASGLRTTDNEVFAADMGLTPAPAACYTEEGFRDLLANYGPLWISEGTPPNRHAVVVTGMYSDGADTYVRISDPWDRAVGVPGAPGLYASTHATGSRYIMRWADFAVAYEQMSSSSPLNSRILHARGTGGRVPNTGHTTVYAAAAQMPRRATGPKPKTPAARAMVIDTDDVERAQRYAPAWSDLFNWVTPESVVSAIAARGMSVQRIQDASGLLNLDRYEVRIGQLPEGLDDVGLLRLIRLNLNDFVDTRNSEFSPYEVGNDDVRWASASPVGAVFKIDVVGPDNAAVVGSLVEDRRWRFTTIHTDWSGDHPVSGHREFGIRAEGDGYVFWTRGADRATDGIGESIAFVGADHLWRSLQGKLVEYVNNNGGNAVAAEPFSERFHPAVVRILYGTAASLGADGDESFTINWDEVQQIAQPTDLSCWAASAAMVIGWRDRMSLTPESIAELAGHSAATGLNPAEVGQFAADMGLTAVQPQSFTIEGFRQLLTSNGPLWVGAAVPGLHAIVVTGMYQDCSDTFVRVTDPWDRAVGSPGAPGPYARSHTTGSRYIMKWEDFVAEYERAATDFSRVNLQILHCGQAIDRAPNTGTSTPPGYAMGAEDDAAAPLMPAPPPPRARAMTGAEAAIAIGGFLLETVRDNVGDVTWELDQFRERKYPNDTPPASPAPFHDGPTIRLDQWPVSGGAVDDISAWFAIDWQFNGTSLGNVRITNIGTNDAIGWALNVRAQIMDDNILYPPNNCAALRVRLHYRFSRTVGSDAIAITDVHLYGDGTHEIASHWVQ